MVLGFRLEFWGGLTYTPRCLCCKIGEEAEESNLKEEDRLTESLNSLLKSGASESEVFAKIEEYKEKFADYGRDRRSAIEFHLRNVERLLKPSRTTSVVLATLQGGPSQGGSGTDASPASSTHEVAPSALESASIVSPASIASVASAPVDNPLNLDSDSERLDSKTLFRHLVKILGVSPEQAADLKDSRFVAAEMDECLKSSLRVLCELRTRLTQCGEDLEAEFNNVRSILTPTQAAKFLVWVANNSACMHMLNELWSKVYPQSGGDDSGDNSP
jgi:hypothetical protein